MGFNIAGIIINKKLDNTSIEKLVENNIKHTTTVSFDEAISSSKEHGIIDIFQGEKGTVLLVALGQIYDISNIDSNIIQFMISDVSDTYYFEKYAHGQLQRKLITSQGEIAEDIGEGIITEDDDFLDKVWEFANIYIQNEFKQQLFDLNFERYQLV